MDSRRNCSITIHHNEHPNSGCIVILGVPRGGTSVVSGLCHVIGVKMGINIDESNMEAREFLQLGGRTDVRSDFQVALAELLSFSDFVGFKDPVAIDWIEEVVDLIPLPIYIWVTRDVVAVAERERIAGRDAEAALGAALSRYKRIKEFFERQDAPKLVISYERLLAHPEKAFAELSMFLTGEVDERRTLKAGDLVKRSADMPNDVNFLAYKFD